MKVFREEQRFTQLWLIVLMSVALFVPITLIFQEYSKENSSISINELIGSTIAILASGLLIFFFKLKTRIDEKGIYYQFFPFHFKYKLISWYEIENAFVRTYDAIGEYGGWGLKGGFFWRKSKGTCINVSGDIGIQLELKNGKKLLIGTQKKEEAISVLKTYMYKN